MNPTGSAGSTRPNDEGRVRSARRTVLACAGLLLVIMASPSDAHTVNCFGNNNVAHGDHGDQNGPHEDVISGGSANNSFAGLERDDTLSGGNGQDNLCGNTGGDLIYGDGDNDDINAGDNSDTVYGGTGRDYIHGGAWAEVIVTGEEADDFVGGDDGADDIRGGTGSGEDSLMDGDGADVMRGGSGSDTFWECANDGDTESEPDYDPSGEGDHILINSGGTDFYTEWCA